MTIVSTPWDSTTPFIITTLGPCRIALLVQTGVLSAAVAVTVECYTSSPADLQWQDAYESDAFFSAMPPGLTDIAGRLIYLDLAQGFKYRLKAASAAPFLISLVPV